MTPTPWFGFWRGLLFALWPGVRYARPNAPAPLWHRVARRRRAVCIALVAVLAGSALALRCSSAPAAPDALWWATTGLMTLLFAWVGMGCATAVLGAWALWRGDPFVPTLKAPRGPIDPGARTALVMPICNEDIAAVFAGLRATCESLAATGAMQLFDVFVLSDSSDPKLRTAEEHAWRRLRAMFGEPSEASSQALSTVGGRIFYRWRRRRVKRKSGNVADFCRRWGRSYRYMVVLDADSTMSGDTLVQLVRLMEQHPRAGIIQTLPQLASHSTLHSRAQRFASRVSGHLFALGLSWWQLGDAHYWGHNAILRVAPFMRHCALARLPGRGGLAGEILSHDFVEAALMGRAGYEVWLAPQLEGSWEHSPSNLLDELQRDRRWCQGNLQNMRLVAEPGWRAAHRAMFATGALSYGVAPMWLLFIIMGLAGGGPISSDASLWLLTLALLLLPRALGVAVIVARREAHAFGGALRLALGALLELLLSSLQAPIRMLAHSMFVVGALTGLRLEWKSPPRAAEALGWGDASRRIGSLALLPLAASLGLQRLRDAAVALAPMLLPLSLAVPFAVLTGHPRAGHVAARLGLLRTPEEWHPPRPLLRAAERQGFADLVPVALSERRIAPRSRALRPLPMWAMAAVAALTIAVPQGGIAPELPATWRAEQEFLATWRQTPTLATVVLGAQAPIRRAMSSVRERPARRIDDALRRRALDAVERAVISDSSPPT
jgi:membrane glycosyltransferase